MQISELIKEVISDLDKRWYVVLGKEYRLLGITQTISGDYSLQVWKAGTKKKYVTVSATTDIKAYRKGYNSLDMR